MSCDFWILLRIMKLKCCRLCSSTDIVKAIDLGHHPLADTFLEEDASSTPEISYPLQLGLCRKCGHVFTLYTVSPEDRYQKHDYSYDSSNSRVSISHFQELSAAAIEATSISKGATIVDIGCNVGTLLAHFKVAGFNNVIGIEPAGNIARIAIENNIKCINKFFDSSVVSEIKKLGKVDLLLSTNVVNHTDDIEGVLDNSKEILSERGVFIFEVPYLLDLVNKTAFDTIYHEHVHYFGMKALSFALTRKGFSIFKVERLEYMCGSIRVYARQGGQHSDVVDRMIEEECASGIYDLRAYEEFMSRIQNLKFLANMHLWKIKSDGGKIIGIGAATKGNTLLNFCRFDSDLISYVTDSSLLKIGKFTPGSRIPIRSDSAIDGTVTHALILPWNIADYLKKKLAHLNLEFYTPQIN